MTSFCREVGEGGRRSRSDKGRRPRARVNCKSLQPTKICISKEIPKICKLLFGGSMDINRLCAARIWILQAFPNFYLAETRDIKGLRSKKFGKRYFLEISARPAAKPRPFLLSFFDASPEDETLESMRRKSENVQKMFL